MMDWLKIIAGLSAIVVPFGAHIVNCMKAKAVGMLILGLVVAPYGWIHGLGVLFGWW